MQEADSEERRSREVKKAVLFIHSGWSVEGIQHGGAMFETRLVELLPRCTQSDEAEGSADRGWRVWRDKVKAEREVTDWMFGSSGVK